MASLDASAAAVSIAAGAGEFLGYALRPFSGHAADKNSRRQNVPMIMVRGGSLTALLTCGHYNGILSVENGGTHSRTHQMCGKPRWTMLRHFFLALFHLS